MSKRPVVQVPGQLPLPLAVPVLPPAMRVVINGWIVRDWHERAACAGTDDPGFYSADETVQEATAKAVCGSCPVRRSCLASALLHDDQGVWGGLTQTARNELAAELAKRNPVFALHDCTLPAEARADWRAA